MDDDLDNVDVEESNIPVVGDSRQNMVEMINKRREEEVSQEMYGSDEGDEDVVLVEEIQEEDDPLAPFIQRDEATGQPMFKMVVDGEEVFMPLAEVQKQHQLEAASRKRMEENATWAKNLVEREEQIRQREAALQSRLVEPPSPEDVDDRDFREEAQNFIDTLLNEDADEAAVKLASILKNARASQQTPVNSDDLVEKAAVAVTKRMSADQEAKVAAARDADFRKGLELFKRDYSNIYNDPKLYGAADNLTRTIADEHPDWMPSQVILEAGRQTQEWVDSISHSNLEPDVQVNDRQTRKGNLVPMPPSRTGNPPKPQEDKPQTAAEVLASLRAARGQVA